MERISKAQIKLVKSLQQKKYRDETNLFVAEGEKCVEELRKGFELEYVVIEEGLEVNQSVFCQAKPVCILSAKRSEIEQMSGLKTPQGVIGVFKKAKWSNNPINDQMVNDQMVLVLDGIQDPGNLGTIIRTCDWFGVHTVLCSQDTADCYNPKVVQATMGALARVHVHYLNLPEWLNSQMVNDQMVNVFGTLLDGRNMYDVLPHHPITDNRSPLTVIIMGNEGNGISQAVRPYITHPIRIPSYPENAETSESLNVSIATAIVLAEFRRQ